MMFTRRSSSRFRTLAMRSIFSFLLVGVVAYVLALPSSIPVVGRFIARSTPISVSTPIGEIIGRSVLGVESFQAIPYAEPPIGELRLRPPKRLTTNLGTHESPRLAPACPQMFVSAAERDLLQKFFNAAFKLPIFNSVTGQEDCLTLNVQRPAGTKAGDKLPVLFWIYGGGFQFGSSQQYDASNLVKFAQNQQQPFVIVAVNYRVGAFGFLGGKKIREEGVANLGLLDQRMGLEWVADNIAAFGGDPERVTLWGESAGSISIHEHFVLYDGDATYKGKPLFRGAIAMSGTAIAADPVDCPRAQAIYDNVVEKGGCQNASDTLDCLRHLPYDRFHQASNSVPGVLSYQALAPSYLPRPDGKVLTDNPSKLLREGKYFAVPMIVGDLEDEGTLFFILNGRKQTTETIVEYLAKYYYTHASNESLHRLVSLYPEDSAEGSPFRTGGFEIYPGFKRLAAIMGDLMFTLKRRVVLNNIAKAAPDIPVWSFLGSFYHGTPVIGTPHFADVVQIFFGFLPNHAMASSRTYFLNFLYNQDPNVGITTYDQWPKWKIDNQELMWFKSSSENGLLKDDFRKHVSDWLIEHVNILRY